MLHRKKTRFHHARQPWTLKVCAVFLPCLNTICEQRVYFCGLLTFFLYFVFLEMQKMMWQDDKDKIARKRLATLREVQRKIDNNLALERDIEEWLAVYDILASPSV